MYRQKGWFVHLNPDRTIFSHERWQWNIKGELLSYKRLITDAALHRILNTQNVILPDVSLPWHLLEQPNAP